MSALPLPAHDPRLVVTIATRGDRLETVLRAYLAGPGREVFEIGDVSSAQAMVADHDHAASRAAMLRFVYRTGRPVIALATRDPGLAGIVWVPKPVHFDALAAAADQVWSMLATGSTVRPLALQLLPPAPQPAASGAPHVWHRRSLHGPYRTTGSDDWTGKIIWLACGALGIAALASLLGWRPAAQGWRPSSGDILPPSIETVALERAVRAAWADAPELRDARHQRTGPLVRSTPVSAESQPRDVAPAAPGIVPTDVPMSRRGAPSAALMGIASPAAVGGDPAGRRELEAAVRRSVAWWTSQTRD